MASPPSSSPTPIAAGRFRPARAPVVPSFPASAGPALSASAGAVFPASAGAAVPVSAGAVVPVSAGAAVPVSAAAAFRASAGSAAPSTGTSDLEELGFLVLEQLVHLPHVGVGEIVEFPLGPVDLVLTRFPAFDQLVQRVLGVPADVADRHPAVLRLVPCDLDVLPPALLGELGEDHPDDDAVVRRVHPEVTIADRLFDRAQRRLVERLHHHHPRFGDVERRQLVDRGLGAVVLGRDLAEHGRVGAAGPDDTELLLGDRDGLFHLFLGPEEDLVYHCGSCRSLAGPPACSCTLRAVRTTLPLSASAKTPTGKPRVGPQARGQLTWPRARDLLSRPGPPGTGRTPGR